MADKKYLEALVEKSEEGEFTAIASTGNEDRHGEVVDVTGWDLKNFKNNPVILWAHNHEEPPIGKATKIWVDKTGSKPVLKFKAVISEATARAREIKQLMDEGIVRAFSVGFRPLDQDGNTFTKQELLEISSVGVPANADAVRLAYKSLREKGFTEDEIKEVGIESDHLEYIIKLENRLDRAESKIDIAVKGLEHLNPHKGRDQRIVKERLSLHKVIAKASDRLMAEKGELPKATVTLIKAIKISNETLIGSQKGELNGKNQRATRQS